MPKRFNGAIKGSAGDFDAFRAVRNVNGAKIRKRHEFSNMVRARQFIKKVSADAIKKVDLIKSISSDEKHVAKTILTYVEKNPQTTYTDLQANVSLIYRGKTISILTSAGKTLKKDVGNGNVDRLYKLLVMNKLVIDPQMAEKLSKK
ncbi:MAG: hypothetical protein WC915_00600 [archaeon]|jgi:hypothetical protein